MLGRLAIVFAVVAGISFSRSDASAEGPQMVITDAIANLTTPATILIEGQEFRPAGLRDIRIRWSSSVWLEGFFNRWKS